MKEQRLMRQVSLVCYGKEDKEERGTATKGTAATATMGTAATANLLE